MKIKELLGTQIVVEDLRRNIVISKVRNLNYKFMVAEWLWMCDGRDDVRWIAQFNSQIARFSDDGVRFAGAYGPRLVPQFQYLIQSIYADNDTRQAVASIWTPRPEKSKDIPCTCLLQVFLREGKLHGIVTMRSNDLWLGLPYDFFNFSQIVNGLAGEMNVDTGSLTLQAGSSHVYENNFEGVERVLEEAGVGMGGEVKSPNLHRVPKRLTTAYEQHGEDFCLNSQEYNYLDVLRAPTWGAALQYLLWL